MAYINRQTFLNPQFSIPKLKAPVTAPVNPAPQQSDSFVSAQSIPLSAPTVMTKPTVTPQVAPKVTTAPKVAPKLPSTSTSNLNPQQVSDAMALVHSLPPSSDPYENARRSGVAYTPPTTNAVQGDTSAPKEDLNLSQSGQYAIDSGDKQTVFKKDTGYKLTPDDFRILGLNEKFLERTPYKAGESKTPEVPKVDPLESAYQANLQISPEEIKVQESLNNLRENARLGSSNMEGQGRGIPLTLVRGQQGKLMEQAGIKEQTLLDRMTLAQATRQAALDASKFALDRADKAKETDKPIEVDGQLVQKQKDGSYKSVFGSPKKNYGAGSIGEYQYAVEQGYTGSYMQYQNEDANRKARVTAAANASGLTASQINSTVNSIAGAFDNEATVKEYNTIKRQMQTFNSLGNSATDDIQRVYSFAKIADPTSAVKEGEYNSIEKYSQALLQRAGLRVSRVFTATGILTPEARAAMGATLQKSLDAAKAGYDQVSSEYQRQIDDAYAGKQRTITNYSNTGGSGNNPLGI